ncbi:hypothetical protein ATE92_1887 [Ulvibacter sp. MAR_2010_11]|uniref:DUF3820 family protein n=1 Tax=Ulvibacter sp. MAR_2010_11 TaxID=1250229 RepID=UPI000C2CAFA6|nr:DUF3820 family protein [Ulvibacter sp. MAR_2010_11]PKA83721.1 hypothetical protein ATE92_1887 [Ulvibacter sp. MAR_2010_11]
MAAGNNPSSTSSNPNPKHLIELANYKMPFGKYKNYYLVNIPEPYYVWFKQKGFPNGKLGRMLQEMYEIKLNGLEDLVRKLIDR